MTGWLGGPPSSQTWDAASQTAILLSRIFAGTAHRRNARVAVTAHDA
jgi:hypothetical protein